MFDLLANYFYVFSFLLPEAGESDPVPVTFRYVVKPKDSMICHVFRPKVPEPAADIKTVRPQTLGQVQLVAWGLGWPHV